MKGLTIEEWLVEKSLTSSEIDFLLMFIVSIATIKSDHSKREVVYNMLNEQFPKFMIEPDTDYFEFENVNLTVQINIPNKTSTKELLERMSAQGLCKPLCDSLLLVKSFGGFSIHS